MCAGISVSDPPTVKTGSCKQTDQMHQVVFLAYFEILSERCSRVITAKVESLLKREKDKKGSG